MKRKLITILSILTLLCISIGFSGCDNYVSELSEEKALEIRTAYFNLNYDENFMPSIDVVQIFSSDGDNYDGFLGAYNDCWVVIIIDNIYMDLTTYPPSGYPSYLYKKYKIDGVEIVDPTPWPILCYKNGNFYELQEAFDKGYLTHSNLLKIEKACDKLCSKVFKK